MSIPFLSYLEAMTASVDNALHAYKRRKRRSVLTISSIESKGVSYLSPQGFHAPRIVDDYDRVIVPENLEVVLLDPTSDKFGGELIRRWRVASDLGILRR